MRRRAEDPAVGRVPRAYHPSSWPTPGAATTSKSLVVLSPVPTNIATVTSLEAVAGREGAEAVEDEEEDEEEE